MDGSTPLTWMGSTLWLVLVISLVPLVAATAVGLLVGLLQAVTQIQDQSLPQTVKVITVLVVLFAFGALLSQPLLRHTERLMDEFPALTRTRAR